MPATKPTNTCEFATTPADPSDVQFPSALVAPGYSFKDIVPYEELNGFFNRTGEWTAYLKDLVPNLVFTGSADYGRAQIDPETEVNFGTNSTFSRFTDTASELTLTLLHSGAGFSQLVMDRFQALGKFVLGNSSSAQISVTDYSAPASEANQTVTVENETAVALGETRLAASAFQPGLPEPHNSGTGTPYAKDTALYSGNMLRARWGGLLSNSANALVASRVDAYNVTFSGGSTNTYTWQLDDYANISSDAMVVVNLYGVNGVSDARVYFPFDVAGLDNWYDSTTGRVKIGIMSLQLLSPASLAAITTGGSDFGDYDAAGTDGGEVIVYADGGNIGDETPQIYCTIEVYSA